MATLYVPSRNNLGITAQIARTTGINGFNIYYCTDIDGVYAKINATVIPNRTAVYGTTAPAQYNQIIYFILLTDLIAVTASTTVYFKMTTVTGGVESNIASSAIVTSKPQMQRDSEFDPTEIKEVDSYTTVSNTGSSTGAALTVPLVTKGRKIVSGYYSAGAACTVTFEVSSDGQEYYVYESIVLAGAASGFKNYTIGWEFVRFKSTNAVDLVFTLSAKI